MFVDFFYFLRSQKVTITLIEFLDLLKALEKNLSNCSVDEFYYLSKTILIKNEKDLDRFDQVFGEFFKGLAPLDEVPLNIEESWINKLKNRTFTPEEKAMIEAMGGLEAVMKRFEEIYNKQKERHQGGNTWIGTGGTSPFGNGGYNPEGIRIGGESAHRRAIKVWEKRVYKDYDVDQTLNTRSMKVALKRLRTWAREGALEELDLDSTISQTAKNAGLLQIELRPEVKNNVKVLLFFDVGGSMDDYIQLCTRLFSAARDSFKHMEYFYFHNCIYQELWKENSRRWDKKIATLDVIAKYNSDYKIIFVGDASMSSYEILSPGGSVEHANETPGIVWLGKIKKKYKNIVWLNPVQEDQWKYTQSIGIISEIFEHKMFPLTLTGISKAMKELQKKH